MSLAFFCGYAAGAAVVYFIGRLPRHRDKVTEPAVRIANGKIHLPPCAVCGYDQHTSNVGAFVRLVDGTNASDWNCFVCGASMRAAHLSSDVAAEIRFRLAKNEAYKAAVGESPDA